MPPPNRTTIKIGTVSPDGAGSAYDQDYFSQSVSNPFTDYLVRNRYERDGHIYMLPLAYQVTALQVQNQNGPPVAPGQAGGTTTQAQPDTVAFVQLASRSLLWVCEWTAQRAGNLPLVPPQEPNDPTSWVLLDVHIEKALITATQDGVPNYRVSGVYVYGHRHPNEVALFNTVMPLAPWLDDNDFVRTYTNDNFFDDGIIDIS